MKRRGIEPEKIFLYIKTVVAGNCAAVLNAGVLPDDICHMVIVVDIAAWICHADNFKTDKIRQVQTVIFHLTDDLFIFTLGKVGVCKGVSGNLVSFVNVFDIFRVNFVVGDSLPVSNQDALAGQKFGVQIKGAF